MRFSANLKHSTTQDDDRSPYESKGDTGGAVVRQHSEHSATEVNFTPLTCYTASCNFLTVANISARYPMEEMG